MHTFGLSAPMKIVAEYFGFTAERDASAAKQTFARSQ
jgi:transketolase